MKKLFLWFFTIVLCCLWAIAGASDPPEELILTEECPVGYSIFGQIPAPPSDPSFNATDSDIATDATVFDDFSGLSEDICRMTWWGFDVYFNGGMQECTEDPMDFEVAFYPDDGTGKPDILNPLYTLPSVTPTRTPTGQLYGPFGDLWIELNRYDLVLDPCISVTEGWLSVRGISSNGEPQDCLFMWVTSPEGDFNMWYLVGDVWGQYEMNQAFCLGGAEYSPTYGACCDPSTGNCDYVEYQDCPQDARFEVDVLCEDLDPPCRATVFCEDFTYSLGTFTSYEAGDPAGWHWTQQQGNTPGSAFHNDDNVPNGCDDWLISPGGYTVADGDSLMWDQRDNYANYITYHGVLISSDYVDGSDPTTATWTELYTGAAPEDAWETQLVDISAFAEETVHIAFRYQGDYSDQWWVDNVCVFGVGGGPCGAYVVGDYNGSESFNVADIISAFSKLKTGNPIADLLCECPTGANPWAVAMDVNNSCVFNISDIIAAFSKLKTGSPQLEPCELCPPDPSPSPDGGDKPLVTPSLRSKARISTGSDAD